MFVLAMCGSSRAALNTSLRFLGPRFLTLQLQGSSLLLLDLVHACNTLLNSSDFSQNAPRTEAVSILADLLSLPDDLSRISVLQPEHDIHVMSCPDIKVCHLLFFVIKFCNVLTSFIFVRSMWLVFC